MTKHTITGRFGSQAALESKSLNACKQCLDEAYHHLTEMAGSPKIDNLLGMIQDAMNEATYLRVAADDRLEDKD